MIQQTFADSPNLLPIAIVLTTMIVILGCLLFSELVDKKKIQQSKKLENNPYNKFSKEINIIEDDSWKINSETKLTVEKFSIKNTTDLHKLDAGDLLTLLSCSVEILEVFEKRIERIDSGFSKYENALMFYGLDLTRFGKKNISKLSKMQSELFSPVKERLDNQYNQLMTAFNEDLHGGVLDFIPENYRRSKILYRMCEYLVNGESDSWQGCTDAFRRDTFQVDMQKEYEVQSKKLDRIDKNTAAAVFFSGL